MSRKEYVILPILVVLLFIQFVPYQLVSIFGQEITLKAELYDPRDVFRGDYVALNFGQETVPSTVFEKGVLDSNGLYNKKLYAQVVFENQTWSVNKVVLERPTGGNYITCTLDYYDTTQDQVILDFGIDRFYIETNTGKPIEDAARDDKLIATLKVWRGQLIMTEVQIQP